MTGLFFDVFLKGFLPLTLLSRLRILPLALIT